MITRTRQTRVALLALSAVAGSLLVMLSGPAQRPRPGGREHPTGGPGVTLLEALSPGLAGARAPTGAAAKTPPDLVSLRRTLNSSNRTYREALVALVRGLAHLAEPIEYEPGPAVAQLSQLRDAIAGARARVAVLGVKGARARTTRRLALAALAANDGALASFSTATRRGSLTGVNQRFAAIRAKFFAAQKKSQTVRKALACGLGCPAVLGQ